jgi:hypothetical protein
MEDPPADQALPTDLPLALPAPLNPTGRLPQRPDVLACGAAKPVAAGN